LRAQEEAQDQAEDADDHQVQADRLDLDARDVSRDGEVDDGADGAADERGPVVMDPSLPPGGTGGNGASLPPEGGAGIPPRWPGKAA
jgi:hypothetical protein